ncbi:hypothetical protein COY90_02220 [Candidatus Roizmanbacteria bacterium CG_4_10_14_0_8_um_filter_39_9]|uniref:CARDB domain-containing protein n=1 Tax=Candidatus Roizmanbacteria bacterium CG_4_10_14_0_8_um_filter_39_9 TaxID=1974829 RepID=A0A2M7QE37_9BACT|nr:MAG: hypothetical protein COY90_02220 [Candidatus Roizmanbacteria bacterium CG_4_10_14_0_8_um_filter_39_9]
MKKIILFLLGLISLLAASYLSPRSIFAAQQTEGVCYSQCIAYKFVWQGTYCFDEFEYHCTDDTGSTLKKIISLLKDVYDTLKSGSNVDDVFKTWFICKPLIENCVVPHQNNCRQTCSLDQYVYSADLSVGHPESSFHGAIYDESTGQIYFKLINNGMGYAWDIDVEATSGHTKNRDGIIQNNQQLFKEKVEHLIYLGARNGPPKTLSDNVKDFLINEALNGKYLKGFKKWLLEDEKSDKKDYNVPNYWIKAIPYHPIGGELNRVVFKVDGENKIAEYNELNNTFVLDIDLRPTPARFAIENFSQKLINQTINSFMVSFKVKNTGEENGLAKVKIFEGKYDENNTPFYETEQIVIGEDVFNFDTIINLDAKNETKPYCGKNKEYAIVVFDEEGNKMERRFSLPIYIGSVNGRVEDLFGKKVIGATIKSSSGEETITNDSGYYHLEGITTLGNVTLTVTHPEFSKSESKVLEFKFVNEFDACDDGNLKFNSINFILKDQDVVFNVLVKDTLGNFIPAHVLASNADWRFEQAVSGSTPLPGMQPGEYFFTVSAPGYKTIGQTINAVPDNQNLEFKMEKLNGRLTDGGLFTHPPQLLWQMERGSEILSQVAATKDGNEIMIYTTRNKTDTGKLYFLNLQTGTQIKVVSGTIATKGQSQACLDTSYDGNTTALYVHTGGFGMAQETRNVVKLFNNQGNEFGMKDFQSGGGAGECDVSPDGFYILPERLMNKGLYVYTRHDIYGYENSKEDVGYATNGDLHFTTTNNIVGSCPKIDQCVHTFNNTVVTEIGEVKGGRVFKIDSSQDASKIAITTIKKAYLFFNGVKSWEKDIKIFGDEADISVSPGGEYVIYSTTFPTDHYRTIRIFTDNNVDKTPSGLPHAGREDVVFVHANDKGLYFMTNHQKTLKFYKVGSYSVEYKPPTGVPTVTENAASGLSYYQGGIFNQADAQRFDQLVEGLVYIANRSINLDMGGGKGTLYITEGTIFSVDHYRNPVLLKGQLTADFNSPAIIYAIKFDRYDLELFKRKLGLFVWTNKLPSSEYFVVKNIHTKFTVRNNPNDFNVAVESGQVNVLADKTEKIITSGKQITIDAKNNIKELIYISSTILVSVTGVFLLIASGILFYYRKTKVGTKIIGMLRTIITLSWKYFTILIVHILKVIKFIVPILWRGIKISFQILFGFLKKMVKKKK